VCELPLALALVGPVAEFQTLLATNLLRRSAETNVISYITISKARPKQIIFVS
jgi:hypothetical protein